MIPAIHHKNYNAQPPAITPYQLNVHSQAIIIKDHHRFYPMTSNDKEFPSNSENEASSLSTSATYSEIDLSLLTSTEGETSPEPHNTPSAIESYTKEASPIFEVKSNELRTSNSRTANKEPMVERDPMDSTYNPSTIYIFYHPCNPLLKFIFGKDSQHDDTQPSFYITSYSGFIV